MAPRWTAWSSTTTLSFWSTSVVDQTNQLPSHHATVVVDMRMELIVAEEDPDGLAGDSIAAPTSVCAGDDAL
jgi:hypothetical protein